MSFNGSHLSLTIDNKSDFPTPFLEVILRWALEHEGVRWRYHATFSRVRSKRKDWYGRGNKHRCWIFFDRRFYVSPGYTNTYRKCRPLITLRYDHRLAVLAHLIFHEVTHATSGNPSRWMYDHMKADGRIIKKVDVGAMEYHTETHAYEMLKKFLPLWPEIAFKVRTRIREYNRHVACFEPIKFREAAREAYKNNIDKLWAGPGLEARLRRLRAQ